jgi:hypothetical protein
MLRSRKLYRLVRLKLEKVLHVNSREILVLRVVAICMFIFFLYQRDLFKISTFYFDKYPFLNIVFSGQAASIDKPIRADLIKVIFSTAGSVIAAAISRRKMGKVIAPGSADRPSGRWIVFSIHDTKSDLSVLRARRLGMRIC